ncbi:MAG TPA: hypothetical protein VLZ83_01575, partial [Edaphocola sp.]|nr:hypothetical protein [Edaphocola sp.]
IIAVRFAAVLAMVDGYNTALQSLVSSYDIRGMIGSQMRSAYLGEYNNDPNDGGSQPDNTNTKNNEQSLQDSNNPQAPQKGDKYVEGVRIRYVGWIGKGGALTLPGIGIFVGKGVLNPKNGFSDNYFSNLIMHEYGHILQAKQYGNLFYYGRIVPTSFASATWGTVTYGFNSLFGNRNENGYIRHYDHNRTWTEWDASNRAYQYFNYPYWNHNWFPISKP